MPHKLSQKGEEHQDDFAVFIFYRCDDRAKLLPVKSLEEAFVYLRRHGHKEESDHDLYEGLSIYSKHQFLRLCNDGIAFSLSFASADISPFVEVFEDKAEYKSKHRVDFFGSQKREENAPSKCCVIL